jgi:hypothetical protein
MISSQRTQNVIVSFSIILALVSSVFLVNNALYYSGSFELAGRMEVSLVKTVVSDIDPTNESLYPRLSFTLNFRTDALTEGNVRLISISATAWLNDDYLSYTDIGTGTASADQLLHPGYNVNFTLARTVNSDTDRNTILQADSTDTWNWYIRVSYDFITFDDSHSRTSRILYLNSTGSTTIL